jgi:hypothetical protein
MSSKLIRVEEVQTVEGCPHTPTGASATNQYSGLGWVLDWVWTSDSPVWPCACWPRGPGPAGPSRRAGTRPPAGRRGGATPGGTREGLTVDCKYTALSSKALYSIA